MNTLSKLSLIGLFFLFSQTISAQQNDPGVAALEAIKSCNCTEIIVNAGGLEKKYTHSWLEGIVYENGYLIFSKGDNKHRWNASQIIFIEEGNAWIRIHMTQNR